MISFCIAASATVAGVMVGYALLDLGEIGPKVAGVYTGGWIGGAVNFLAVSKAVEMTPSEFSVSISASSVVSITALLLLIVIPSVKFITRYFPTYESEHPAILDVQLSDDAAPAFRLTHISGALALSFIICAIAQ